MNRIAKVTLALVALLATTPFVTPSLGQQYQTINGVKVYGDCIEEYLKYENDPDHKAFAVSRNGRYCGWAYNYDTVDEAEDTALSYCREGGTGCKVIASY